MTLRGKRGIRWCLRRGVDDGLFAGSGLEVLEVLWVIFGGYLCGGSFIVYKCYFLRESVSQTVLDFIFFSLSTLITIPSGSVCMRYLTFWPDNGWRNEATKSCPSRIPSLQIYVNRCYINHQYFVATLLFKHEIIRFSRPMLNEFPEMCSNAFLLSLSHICIFMPQFITLLVRLDYVF